MKIVEATKEQFVMEPTRKEFGARSFVFDIGVIPLEPTPKQIKIVRRIGDYTHTWSMSWRKFLNVGCVDTIVILEKSLMTHSVVKTK